MSIALTPRPPRVPAWSHAAGCFRFLTLTVVNVVLAAHVLLLWALVSLQMQSKARCVREVPRLGDRGSSMSDAGGGGGGGTVCGFLVTCWKISRFRGLTLRLMHCCLLCLCSTRECRLEDFETMVRSGTKDSGGNRQERLASNKEDENL